jgi:hypothetical protein
MPRQAFTAFSLFRIKSHCPQTSKQMSSENNFHLLIHADAATPKFLKMML